MVTVLVAIKHIFCSVSFCTSSDIFNEAIVHCPESFFFKDVPNFLSLHLRNNFPVIFQSIPIYIFEQNPCLKIKCCFNLVHTINLCVKLCSSIFKSNGSIPIGPDVAPLAMFTFNGFLNRSISSVVF